MMTVKVLSAGDGYAYLTNQVASADVVREKGQGLVDYYAESGNPPGVWMGSGRDFVGLEGVVTESQMAALYGECRHPDADRIEAQMIANGATVEEALKATQLGRAMPTFKNEPDDYDKYIEQSFVTFQKDHGRTPRRGEEQREVRFEATRNYLMLITGETDVADRKVRLFLAERGSKERHPVSGYDLVFTPPKSVSTLWALSDQPTRQIIEKAHHEAVAQSIAFLEQHCAVGRQGAHSIAQVDLEGFVVAAFDHSTSRTGDPNLHTHAVIANRGRTATGKILAVDAQVLFQYAVAGSERYNASIMGHLNRELGVTTVARHTRRNAEPVYEIAGVPQELNEGFSQRRAAVKAELAELEAEYRAVHGHDPSPATRRRLAQAATLSTRPEKDDSKTLAQLLPEWRQRAAQVLGRTGEHYLDASTLPQRAGAEQILTHEQRAVIAQFTVARLGEKRARWTFAHVDAEANRQVARILADSPAGRELRQAHGIPEHLTADQLLNREGEADVVAAIVHQDLTISVSAPELIERPAALKRANGEPVMRSHQEEWHTSVAMYDAEQTLLAAGTKALGPMIDPHNATLVSKLGKHELLPSQEAVARRFLASGAALDFAVGPAGTGKTTTMKAFVEGAQMGGARVIALSPTLAAAAVLGDEIGAPAESIQMFLASHRRGRNSGRLAVGPDTFILIDEVGMASTPHLAEVLAIATEHGAAVRGIGDPEQLSSPGAGGFLRYFHDKVGAAELHEVLRFDDTAERDATLALRAGDTDVAEFYIENGRVHAGTRDELLDELYDDWQSDTATGRDSVMIAQSNEDVRRLAGRAQQYRVERGEVELTDVALDAGENAEVVNYVGIGDRIVTREVRRDLTDSAGHPVSNGASWIVLAERDGALDVQRVERQQLVLEGRRQYVDVHGATVTLPAEYVRYHVDLAYASTIMRVQGRTVDVSRALWDDKVTRQDAYVAMSRGRSENHIYAVTETSFSYDAEHPTGLPIAPRAVIEKVITNDGAEVTASATYEAALVRADSLHEWLKEYEYTQREFAPPIDHERVRDVLQSAFGDASFYVRDDNTSWTQVARAISDHDRATGDVVRHLQLSVSTYDLSTDPAPGRLVVERLGEVGPGRRTGDAAIDTYLEQVEQRIHSKLSTPLEPGELPHGRDLGSLRAAWNVTHVAEPPNAMPAPPDPMAQWLARNKTAAETPATVVDDVAVPAGVDDQLTRAQRAARLRDAQAPAPAGTEPAPSRAERVKRLAPQDPAKGLTQAAQRALDAARELERRDGPEL
ncbi:MobF family relaxase [Demequina sp.]|uniref:MobF family relaxase n=1 Tax=Demequina sp. TaxID=2050685 RepID=UPI003D0FB27E